jgi:autotransporter-associated beta strand protein
MKSRIISSARLSFPLASAIAALLAAHSASATTFYWDTNGATTANTAATGTWMAGSAANWSTAAAGNVATSAVTTTNADDLIFAATGMTAGTITVDDTQFANSIRIQVQGITLTGGTINIGSAAVGSGFSFGNSQTINVNSAIILNSAATEVAIANTGNQTVTFGNTATITGSAASGTQNLTIGGGGLGGGSTIINGIISDGVSGGKVGVTVNGGAGSFTSGNLYTLAGANTYTGATTITGGTLALGANNVLADTTAVTIGGGSLRIGNGFADAVDTLDVTAAATITVGAGASLAFADSSGKAWAGSLTITGAFVSGASLRFGTDANGLTPAQIAKISGPGLSDIAIDSQGYITATVTGGYNVWAITNAGGQGPELDFDNDGVANGVEFFMNAAAGFTANPVLNGSNTITWTNGGNIPASAYGTQFVVQTSPDLVNWTNVPVGQLASNTDGPGGSLSYTLTGAAPRFVRLVVTP